MKAATAERLHRLNRDFYEGDAGEQFSATRGAPWPGWQRMLPHLTAHEPLAVLDLGCGNGRLYAWLRDARGGSVRYLGVDQSERLLTLAAERYPEAMFQRADLLDAVLPHARFDLVCLFGVLHHVPGQAARLRLVRRAAERTAPGGLLALTLWRFDREPRLQRLRLPPAELTRHAIEAGELDPGDALLRFGAAGRPRYCHLCSDDEARELAEAAGGRVLARYAADGQSGALNDYLLLAGPPEAPG